jgi:hypothetical protein
LILQELHPHCDLSEAALSSATDRLLLGEESSLYVSSSDVQTACYLRRIARLSHIYLDTNLPANAWYITFGKYRGIYSPGA